ncbi:DUF2635 domain-containing protein [Uruburuella suis]|jgi:hypothetical protein|uniref:DUF2635 domain-containing protein n=1 Tax=Uruburuella suis TaxID=252130 RepID=UPI001B6BA53D|nr:DUF2635 domain-containing protein [Uruburuella suis]MBP8874713.1 DUF2635 domain-containing protein [Neisseria sp.]
MTIKVKAAPGLAVPTEHNPHEYIGQEPAEVAADSLYYRRLLDDGDLLPVADEAAATKAKTAKGAE